MALDRLPDAFAVDVALLKPTQFDTGMAVVRTLMKKIITLWDTSPDSLDKYCQEWVVPVVVGPNNHMYMINRHSECLALHYSEISNPRVYVRMVVNWSHMTEDDFWRNMVEKEMCYLKKKGKGEQASFLFSELPPGIAELPDDPYRSLAWACRKNDPAGFQKPSERAVFTEFKWSDYLRGHEDKLNEASGGKWLEFLSKNSQGDQSVQYYVVPDNVLKAAIELCRLPQAQHLPGFISQPLPAGWQQLPSKL